MREDRDLAEVLLHLPPLTSEPLHRSQVPGGEVSGGSLQLAVCLWSEGDCGEAGVPLRLPATPQGAAGQVAEQQQQQQVQVQGDSLLTHSQAAAALLHLQLQLILAFLDVCPVWPASLWLTKTNVVMSIEFLFVGSLPVTPLECALGNTLFKGHVKIIDGLI